MAESRKDPPDDKSLTAAEALKTSRDKLLEDYRRWGEIRPLIVALRDIRIENHLSQKIAYGWRDSR